LRERSYLGEEHARAAVGEIELGENQETFYDTLVKDSKSAIAIAEPTLFKKYGKKNIIGERPYECYLVNGFWYIRGTLPKVYLGGTFEMILRSKNGEVIWMMHGK